MPLKPKTGNGDEQNNIQGNGVQKLICILFLSKNAIDLRNEN